MTDTKENSKYEVYEVYEVWGIFESNLVSNHYNVGRQVEWERKLVVSVHTLDEAKKHVKNLTRSHHSTCGDVGSNLILLKTEEEKDAYLELYCFTSDLYIAKRRFFIGKPSEQLMKLMVHNAGMKLLL